MNLWIHGFLSSNGYWNRLGNPAGNSPAVWTGWPERSVTVGGWKIRSSGLLAGQPIVTPNGFLTLENPSHFSDSPRFIEVSLIWMFWVVMFVLVVSGLLACLFGRLVDWFVGWLVGWLVLLLLLLLLLLWLWLSLWCLALWICFFWAALYETFCVHHPRICWRAGCSQHHTTDVSLNITIDFSNHQSPENNIDNADTTTVTSTFLQSNSSPIPGRYWKTMFLFNARDMIFRPLLEGDFPPTYCTPTYHQQREESCWPISCCSSINFLQYLGLTRWQRSSY